MQSISTTVNEIFHILFFLFSPRFWNWHLFYSYSFATFQVLSDQMWPVAAALEREALDTAAS